MLFGHNIFHADFGAEFKKSSKIRGDRIHGDRDSNLHDDSVRADHILSDDTVFQPHPGPGNNLCLDFSVRNDVRIHQNLHPPVRFVADELAHRNFKNRSLRKIFGAPQFFLHRDNERPERAKIHGTKHIHNARGFAFILLDNSHQYK